MGGAEEERGDAAEEQEGGGEREERDAGSEGADENDNENGREGGKGRNDKNLPLRFQTYKEAVKKYSLLHADYNMVGKLTSTQISS